jgi:hypothetical protein
MKKTQRKIISVSYLYMWYRFMLIYINLNFDFLGLRRISSPRTKLLAARCECMHLIKINCLALWLDESAHACTRSELRGASCEDWKSAFTCCWRVECISFYKSLCDHSKNFAWINSKIWRIFKKCLSKLCQFHRTFLTNPSNLLKFTYLACMFTGVSEVSIMYLNAVYIRLTFVAWISSAQVREDKI